MLYISNHLHDFTVWDVVYNSTELFEGHRLQHLLPGTKYLIKLGVSSLCLYRFPCPLLLLFVPSSLPPSKKKKNPKTQNSCIAAIHTENSLHILNVNDVDLIPTFILYYAKMIAYQSESVGFPKSNLELSEIISFLLFVASHDC